MLDLLIYIPVFLFGIVIGSFLNVLIYRLPREISFVKGFSKCPHCDHRLFTKDLIPVFSFLFLKGQCRYCKGKISIQYPLVELANAIMYIGCFARYGFTLQAGIFCIICSALMVIAVTDWQFMIIPDSMNLVIGLCGLALLAISPSLWLDRLIGAVCVSGVMLLIALVSSGRAMGGGDIKLMAVIGLCFGWKLTLFITAFGAILGTLAVIVLSKTKYALGKKVQFGSFLSIAAIMSIFVGEAFIAWYLGLLVHEEGCT
ncbi:MAG: prepilin peptidase [Oscillospiraceae bacterium]